ncbi:NADH-quinone oxidoreductase subunit L [bacterium (Candidatus Blackallbacteria) CG17_big_fil_post_rev_8_21_14_2_50_48_46]|uniref:NADH-quinone oxidoreductase subunit L n=1 Tax=bacterium (Candidatus Blackallbacteria) CG17_big_fil_post_rev_8_21_14_2_50_48_46 TaxID=2014261 RepID=A0A2M7FXR4_9BACT|nr:MAG: NADH-quinone oxidoreductase subunit L [bacterium (Candidatus Blackallbacteria) CG18_big_fil_WC_8_21_14_2_50_49_26]PIW14067.1 MAG: NADH-quinone oxidoreductase subunit L [bacterium (Candidatus Blackallbacteria) CG17_big_fil_post_rev_8_21_14_2_50_48_46]PIW46884.1 MAG: NADH-quinone oxidoreductase subunit L [bacterium (Candidatus Blackallbacteria) CG13_big_fil_rev_8_21_14_2_50_49_14]
MPFLTQNAWLPAFFPLLAGTLIFILAAFQRKANQAAIGISITGVLLAFVASLGLLGARFADSGHALQGSLRWLTAGQTEIAMGWSVDNLTAMMLVVVTFISLLVQIYSAEYMSHEEGIPRYYGALSLFTFSMLLLVLADNLLVLYMGWELVGVCSYLLIGFFTFKPEAAAAAKKAFLVNRIGDFGFLLGILILFYMTGSLQFSVVTEAVAAGKLPGALLALAGILLFCGPIGKSAQFPLHVWLPDAMEGPTPVSALIHAATMVAAGVYMVAKLMPLFAQATSPLFGSFLVLDAIAWIGGITALLAAAIAVTQTDIKRVLAYSTVSQLGFMMMALGMYQATTEAGHLQIIPLGYTAGLFHLMTHAFFKAMLFLCSGSVIHAVHSNDMRVMGGLRKFLPVTALACLIGTASISGFPFLTAGFWSKDEILLAMWEAHSPLFGLAALAAVLTAFYMFRLYFMTFEGSYRGELAPEQIHDSGWLMKGPLVILAIPSLLAGFVGTPWTPPAFHIHSFLHFSPVGHEATGHAVATHTGLNPVVLGVSLFVFLVGLGLAWAMYGSDKPALAPQALAERFAPLHKASLNRFYFDELYLLFIRWVVMGFARISAFFDKYILDGLLVNGVGLFTIGSSETLKYLQSGRIAYYALSVVSILVVLLLAFLKLGFGKVGM